MTFKEWFKALYVTRGFVSSEKELAEAFEAGAAAEREECAKLCDERAALENAKASDFKACGPDHHLWAMYSNNASQNTLMAREIRARSNAI